MAKIRIVGDSSGYVELAAPDAAGNNTLELPSNATKLVGADASNSLNVTGIATFSSGVNVGTGASISSPATNVLTLGTNSSERVRITSDGLIGINHENPTAGLSINKFGTQPAPSGNTYTYPAGNWSTVWNTTTANSTDYWCGFVGGYNVSSATVNISLSPNVFNFNTQAGIYIAGEATSTSAADFTIGKIIGGSVVGVSTVAGTQRATKSEMFRIDSSGRVKMPYQPSFFVYGNTDQSITSADTFTKTTLWGGVSHNTGSHWSSNRFTAPVAGKYLFGVNLRMDNVNSGYSRVIIGKNGSTNLNSNGHAIARYEVYGAGYHTNSVTILFNMAVDDYVEVYAYASEDASFYVQSESQWWGYLVG